MSLAFSVFFLKLQKQRTFTKKPANKQNVFSVFSVFVKNTENAKDIQLLLPFFVFEWSLHVLILSPCFAFFRFFSLLGLAGPIEGPSGGQAEALHCVPRWASQAKQGEKAKKKKRKIKKKTRNAKNHSKKMI